MAFELLNRKGARASGVAINITQSKGAEEGKGLSGFFRVAADVAEKAGWNGDTKVSILVGTGEDAGVFLLTKDAQGRTKPFKPNAGASYQVSFSAMSAGFKETTGGTQPVEHEVTEDGAIKVTVPALRASKSRKSKATKE